MSLPSSEHLPLWFPLLFAGIWFAVTTALGWWSGWYALMRRYPNRLDPSMLTLKGQSGSLGGVNMRSILKLGVCPSGLRIGMVRLLGPFCRDFLVPWEAIHIHRKDRFFWRSAVLDFGVPACGTLTLRSDVADRLARAAAELWPEPGPFPKESASEARARIFKQWSAMTAFAATFFLIVPRVMAPKGSWPPAVVAICFPAIVFGVVSVVRYIGRDRR